MAFENLNTESGKQDEYYLYVVVTKELPIDTPSSP